mmetsp:Transcript_7976/g.18204  ORF Transcript_7976/g.18204 Transcript_7976/m.18204 type:complete len:209 (+) Transcript_7976:58-684(+)
MFFRKVYEPFGGVHGGSSLFYRPKQRRRQCRQHEEGEMRRTERAERARLAAAMRQEMVDEERRRDEKHRGTPGTHQLVRGPDGRVYRLVPRTNQTRVESKRSNAHSEEFQSPDDRSDDAPLSSSSSDTWRDCIDCSASRDDDSDFEPADHHYGHGQSQSQKLREVVLVEDVPEDEIEDDELRDLRSVWRNRRPSPGLLMEPVELFRRN